MNLEHSCIPTISAQGTFYAVPWLWKPTRADMEQCRDKNYRLSTFDTTPHCFYSGFVGRVPSMRVSKENPAVEMRSFVADIDAPLKLDIVLEALDQMMLDRRPRFLESTLSGKWRLLWVLERPFVWGHVDDPSRLWDTFLKMLAEKLKLPNLFAESFDRKSCSPTQMWWNHCNWGDAGEQHALGKEFILKVASEAFDKVTRKHSVAQGRLTNLQAAAEELARRYPRFSREWDVANFAIGDRGSSFWVDGSTSHLSAIVKEEGIFTFADHADRRFYPWKDLLGDGWVEKDHSHRDYEILNTYYFNDAENRYYKDMGAGDGWLMLTQDACSKELIQRGLSKRLERDDPDQLSELDQMLIRLRNNNRVSGLGPFMWRDEKVVKFDGDPNRYLNSFCDPRPAPITAEITAWGESGKFPFISWLVDHLFEGQDKDMWLSFSKMAQRDFIERRRQLKQAMIVAGPQGTGKTLLQTGVLARLLGGFSEGTGYLTMETQFTGRIFDKAMICIDDGESGTTPVKQRQMTERLKTLVSKGGVKVEEKFKTAGRGEWFGVISISVNTDATSLHQTMPDTTMAIADKLIILRVKAPATPDGEGLRGLKQSDWEKILDAEIPFFSSWLYHAYEVPSWAISKGRYSLIPYHNELIMAELEHMSEYFLISRILLKAMRLYFGSDPEGVNKDKFVGGPEELCSRVEAISSYTMKSTQQQQAFQRQLLKFVQSARVPNAWVHYDRSRGEWTVFRDRLPPI